MSLRFLFGPVSPAYADDNLHEFRDAGQCRIFGSDAGVDLPLRPDDRWDDLFERLPADWRPDFVVLQMQYSTVPRALWQAPVPVIGLAGDWNWLWHGYRRLLPRLCDLVLTDRGGALALQQDGVPAWPANLLQSDLPATHAALGLALARHARFAEAATHLETALAGNPLDNVSARLLHDVLGRDGCPARQLALARRRRQLSAAAPGLVPAEPRYQTSEVSEGFGSLPAEPRYQTSEVSEDFGSLPATVAPLRIAWQGAQAEVHSLAVVNRSLCAALAARGHELTLLPPAGPQPPTATVPLPAALVGRAGAPLSGPADVHVTHQWPPDFTPPREGRWVVIQPWEFGSMPRAWLAPLRDRVDELWVPSRFVRDCFVRGGVPAGKVHVVPNGVADVFFQDDQLPKSSETSEVGPTAEKLPKSPKTSEVCLQTQKRCKLLFVGGTLHRKGFDLLLKAYRQVFCDRDDVCLVVKDMGVGTFYQGQTAEAAIAEARRLPHAPEIVYVAAELTDEQMAALYRACDAVVQPYRGEGFCLPVAEAMACARPVIVTGYGPVLDYATEETAYLLPYRIKPFAAKRVGDIETVETPFLAEPDTDALRRWLRHVYEQPDEARERGRRARAFVKGRLTWAHAAAIAEVRLAALRDGATAAAEPDYRYTLQAPLAEGMIERLHGAGVPALELEPLRARLELAPGRYTAARWMLEQLITREPRAFSPRLALCDVLLQESTDKAAAEQALRAALALNPDHARCRKTLEALLGQRNSNGPCGR